MADLRDLVVAPGTSRFDGDVTFTTTVDINGGTIDNVTITNATLNDMVAVSADQFTGPLTGDVIGEIGNGGSNRNPAWFTNIDATGNASIGGTLGVTGIATLPEVNIDSGFIDGTRIGQTVQAAADFLNVSGNTITANTGFIGNITGPSGGTVGTSTLNNLTLNGNLVINSGNSFTLDGQTVIDADRNAIFESIQVNQTFEPATLTVTGTGVSTVAGSLEIAGNLTVSGTQTTINTEQINLADIAIELNTTATGTPADTNYGLIINRGAESPVTLFWNQTTGRWTVGTGTTGIFEAATFFGNITGDVTGNVTGDVTGNADTADAWSTARSVTFATGDVTGTFSIDGSANVTNVDLTIEDNSVALGTQTTGNYAQDVGVSGNGLSITGAPGEGTQFVVNSNAVATADPQTLVFRNALGDFAARVITADTFTGNIDSTAGVDNLFTTTVGDSLTVTGTATFNNSVTVSAGQTFATDTAAISGGSIVRTPIGQGAGNQADVRGDTVIAVTGFEGDLTGDVTGNADTASALDHTIQISLSGDVTGTSTGNNLAGGGVTIPVTIQPDSVALGTDTTGNYARDISVTGGGLTLSGTPGEGTQYEISSNATNLNTPNTIVQRDTTGSFSANTVSADLTGDVTGTLLGNVDIASGTSNFNNIDVAGSSTLASVDINSGNIDGTTIGASVQADADFLDVSGATITATTGFVGNITGPDAGQTGTSTLNNLTLNGDLTVDSGVIQIGTNTVIDENRNAFVNNIDIGGSFAINTITIGETTPGVSGDGSVFEGAGGDSSFNSTLSVSGTFTADGSARFAAPQITLNYDLPGDTAPSENAGIIVERGNLSDVEFIWNESLDRWSTGGQPLTASDFVGSIGATTRSTGQFTTIDTSSNADIGGILTVTQTSTLTGAVSAPGGITGSLIGQVTHSAGTSTFDNLTITGDVSIDGILSADNFELPGVTNAGTLNLSGTLDVSGNMSGDADLTIQGTADIGTDLIVRGQPRIQGTTIRLHTEVLTGSLPSVDDDVGIVVNRGDDADIKFLWNEGVDRWIADTALQSDNIYGELTGSVNVGAGETLDVSAGTLTLADNQISGNKVEGGTINEITINTINSGNAVITGGSIDGTVIGGTTSANITGDTIIAETGFAGPLFGQVTATINGGGTSNFDNLNVQGTTTLDDVTVNGITTIANDLNAQAGTTATFDAVEVEDLTINQTINITNFDVGGTLTVTGLASFENNFIDINSNPTGASDAGINVGRFGTSDATLKWDVASGQWSFSGADVAASSFIGTLVGPVDSSSVDIDGGNIDNTPIGENTRSSGQFTTLDATGTITGSFSGPVTSTNVDIDGGDISSTTIGANGATTGQFTTVAADTINVFTGTVTAQTVEATNTPYGFIGNLDGQINDISNWSTADLAEDPSATATSGTQYFTTTRVDAHLSGGLGVTYTNGTINIGQPVAPTDNVTFNDVRVDGDITVIGAIDVPNLTVTGDLTVNGTTTTLNTETINLEDAVIRLNNGGAASDSGIEVARGANPADAVELLWNETAGRWTVNSEDFQAQMFYGDLTGDVTGNVTAASGQSSFASVVIDGGNIDGTAIGVNATDEGNFTTVDASGDVTANRFFGPVTGNVTGTVSDISNHTTSALAEGSRLYFTDARVDARLDSTNTTGGTGVSYANGTISIGQPVGTSDDVTFRDVQVTGTLDANTFNPTNITTTGNVTVGNSLTVNGSTTLGDTVNIKDNEIVLNSDFSGGSPTDNVGFIVNRDSAGSVSFIWDEAADKFTIGGNTMVAGTFEGNFTSTGTSTFNTVDINTVDIDGGNIDGTKIGASTADTIIGTDIDGETITASVGFVGDITGNVTGGLTLQTGETVDVSSGTFTVRNDQISGDAVNGGTISNASLAGNNAGNSITGVDITVGFARTLNVAGGTLTLANNQISGDKIDGGIISDATLTGNGTTNSISGYDITVGAGKALTVNGTTNVSVLNATGLASLDGGIDVDGAFTVADTTGDTAISGTLSAGATTVNGTLDVTGLASLDGGIDVDGAFTVADTSGNVSTTGSITGGVITSNSGFVGNINSNGASVFSGTINLNGATVSNATFDLTGNLTGDVTSTGTSSFSVLNVTNLASLDGGIDVDGAFTVANATGNISTSGTLTAAATTLTSSLDVAGLASLDGGIDVDGAFTVANTSGNVNTSGSITGNTITATSGITGNITSIGTSVFSGTVDLNGATVNNAAFNLTGNLTGNVTSSGSNSFATVTVTGLSSLDGGLNINDNLTVDAANGNTAISGTLSSGATTISGTLSTSGLASLGGGIDVDGAFTVADTTGNVSTSGSLDAGNTTIAGTLGVTGLASLDGGISVDGAFTVADTTGNVSTSGTVNAGDITGDTITATTEFVGDIVGDITSTGTSSFSNVNITGGSLSNISLSLGAGSSVSANAAFNLTGNVTGNVTSSGASSFSDATISGGTINGVVIGGSTPGQITGSTITANNGFSGNITGNVIGNVTGDVVGNVTGTVSSLANHTTDDLANGTVNKYYSDILVDAHLSGGVGVTYTNGVIDIGQPVGTNDDVTFNDVTVNGQLQFIGDLSFDNLTVTGNLEVQGSTTTIDSELIELADNIILLNSNETGSPSVSAGLEIQRGTSANKQLTWNETTDKWTVGSETFVAGNFEGDVTGELTGNVTASTGTSSFNAITASGTITSNGGFDGDLTGSVTGNVTGTVSSLSNHTTDDLVEGANLYYTTARLESRIGGNLTTSIIPAQDAVYNIGSATEQFANGFFSGTVDAGTLTAQTKSFIIDHPTKSGMKLRYGSLEGPENGVYVRGKLKGTNTIEMPDYWTGLVDEDSITVTLTANRGYQQLFVADIVNNTVIVGIENKDIADIDCFYTVWAERKDVAPFQVEYTDKGEE